MQKNIIFLVIPEDNSNIVKHNNIVTEPSVKWTNKTALGAFTFITTKLHKSRKYKLF